ncbi:hypothetical protein Ahy_B04g070113 isoform C [Arachis hypogaea]|uniref:Uncharacterized protein n=1 Tax=Arachis hypogaea TaxID=3818 RepID=A0A444ZEU6_ARAHY|nr:hypothetical protein Ahy_B04g070113 isoform C [Arachis hypogaea]
MTYTFTVAGLHLQESSTQHCLRGSLMMIAWSMLANLWPQLKSSDSLILIPSCIH